MPESRSSAAAARDPERVREKVLLVAKGLGLTDANELAAPDSFAIVDLIVGLEEAFAITIPSSGLRVEKFASVDSVAALVLELLP